MKRALLVSWCVFAVAGASALLAPHESRGQQGRVEILPEAEIEVAPCCVPGASHTDPDWAPELRSAQIAPPEGQPLEEDELVRVRKAARGLAPRGRDLERAPQLQEPMPAAPRTSQKFNGTDYRQSGGYVPPDTQLAAGPDRLLEAVNSVIRLSDKNGNQAVMQTAREHFDRANGAFVFDPKAYYDRMSGRFFLVYLELDQDKKKSFLLLSVSRSASPAGLGAADWCNYEVKTKKGPTWADYPGLGMNEDWVAVSTNNFKFAGDGSFKSSYLWVIDKAPLVDNGSSCPKISVSRIRTKKDRDGRSVFNPQVAQHYDASGLPGSPLFAVNTQYLSFSDEYALWRIHAGGSRENGRARPVATVEMVSGAGYAYPPQASQRGSDKPLDAGDLRVMQQLVFRDGALWVVHTSGCTLGDSDDTFSCVRVARIEPHANGATLTFQDLFGVADHFLFWPGIGVAGNGDVVAAFHIAGKKRRLGTAFNGMPGGASRFGAISSLADEFDKVVNLAKGKCPTELPTSKDEVRTGDYIGVSPDPDSSEMWLGGEFARKLSGKCAWATTIARVKY